MISINLTKSIIQNYYFMKKHLEFVEGTSSKFWCVETNENLMTITYGKIGTAGKSDTKSMPSAEAAEKEAIKQANGKLKKGYIEKDAPETSGSAAIATGKKPAEVKAVKAPAKPVPQADVADDGQLKEWHSEDYWDACFWDAETYEDLDKPTEDQPKQKSRNTIKDTPSEELSEEQIEHFKEKFLDACQNYRPDNYNKYIEKLRPVMSTEEFGKMLTEGMVKAHQPDWNDVEPETFIIIEHLLAEGVCLPGKEDREDETLDTIAQIYLDAKGTKTYQDAIDECYTAIFKPIAEEAAKLLRIAIDNLKAGKYADKDGIDKDKLGIDRLGFRFDADRDIEVRVSGALHHAQKSYILEKTEYKAIKLNDVDVDIEEKYLAFCLRPIIEEMMSEGIFDNITTLGHIIFTTRYDKVFYEKTVNEASREKVRNMLDKQMEVLETTEDWEGLKDSMRSVVKTYLICGFDPDGLRCLNILKRFIYSGNNEASGEGYYCLDESKKLNEKYFIPYTFELAMHSYNGFNWYWFERHLQEILDKQEYEPARLKLTEWEKEKKTLTYKEGKNKEEDDDDEEDEKDNKSKGSYTDEDLFRETDTMIARANHSGRINIRFKVEGRQGYTDVLDYLNNLMRKGYSTANDGYEMGVYFVAKPEFPKIKFHDYMPRVPEMALFHKAMMYEELHEQVRDFVQMTVNLFDHYHDLDGEYSTVAGTFAAIAASMYDTKFMDLAVRLAEETDGEHEKIAYYFADDLKRRYGVTPETVAAIYELGASCDHEDKSCKELYTVPENLEAFMEHYSASSLHCKKWHLRRFLQNIAGSSKGILKKIKEYFDGATDHKVKAVYAEFYNLALEILGEEDGKDYGEPLYADEKPESNIVVDIEQFEESMPVIITVDEAVKRSGKKKEEISSTEGRAVFVFRTSAITNPYILDLLNQNREAIAKLNDICTSYTCYSANNLEKLGNKWAFDLKGAACQHGMIIYDGKNEPVVLYGVLDYANILRKFGKKSTTDRKLLEQLRVANFKIEAPKGSPVPEWMDYNDEIQDNLGTADDNLYRSQYLSAKVNLEKVTKEHPQYPASLLLWAQLMIQRKDAPALKRIYTELLELVPEHNEYWNKMLDKVNRSIK